MVFCRINLLFHGSNLTISLYKMSIFRRSLLPFQSGGKPTQYLAFSCLYFCCFCCYCCSYCYLLLTYMGYFFHAVLSFVIVIVSLLLSFRVLFHLSWKVFNKDHGVPGYVCVLRFKRLLLYLCFILLRECIV